MIRSASMLLVVVALHDPHEYVFCINAPEIMPIVVHILNVLVPDEHNAVAWFHFQRNVSTALLPTPRPSREYDAKFKLPPLVRSLR